MLSISDVLQSPRIMKIGDQVRYIGNTSEYLKSGGADIPSSEPVSYTHLTLPTIPGV